MTREQPKKFSSSGNNVCVLGGFGAKEKERVNLRGCKGKVTIRRHI